MNSLSLSLSLDVFTLVLQAVTFLGFLTGFVAVLCIGNYYRAKKAMERQKQRRLARLTGNAGNGVMGVDSPGSYESTTSSNDEKEYLFGGRKQQETRRRNVDDGTDSLMLDIDNGPRPQLRSI